jgi:hypothetical protein
MKRGGGEVIESKFKKNLNILVKLLGRREGDDSSELTSNISSNPLAPFLPNKNLRIYYDLRMYRSPYYSSVGNVISQNCKEIVHISKSFFKNIFQLPEEDPPTPVQASQARYPISKN